MANFFQAVGQSGSVRRLADSINADRKEENERIRGAEERGLRLDTLRQGLVSETLNQATTIQNLQHNKNIESRAADEYAKDNRKIFAEDIEQSYLSPMLFKAHNDIASRMGFVDTTTVPGKSFIRSGDMPALMEEINSEENQFKLSRIQLEDFTQQEVKIGKEIENLQMQRHKFVDKKGGDVDSESKEMLQFDRAEEQLKQKRLETRGRMEEAATQAEDVKKRFAKKTTAPTAYVQKINYIKNTLGISGAEAIELEKQAPLITKPQFVAKVVAALSGKEIINDKTIKQRSEQAGDLYDRLVSPLAGGQIPADEVAALMEEAGNDPVLAMEIARKKGYSNFE